MAPRRACEACRRKKRWCNRELPSCAQCSSAGHQCPGYGSYSAPFVNLDIDNFKGTDKRKLYREAALDARKSSVEVLSHHPNDKHSGAESTLRSPVLNVQDLFGLKHLSDVARHIRPGSVRYNALNALLCTATDFSQVFESLWNSYCEGYCITREYWPRGLSQLASRNQILDLALMALSAKRLSFNGRPELLLLSYEAYGRSLSLFRHQIGKPRSGTGALLATVSLVFTLFEACSFQPEDLYRDNKAFDHLSGAMAFMRGCGPQAFTVPGFCEVFQKIREMVTVLSFVKNERTIFLEQEWFTVPWHGQPKGWRDLLYDIATSLTGIVATQRKTPSPPESYVKELLNADANISDWQEAWLSRIPPQTSVTCHNICRPRSCTCDSQKVESLDAHDFLLHAECRALQLLVDCELWNAIYECPQTGISFPPSIGPQSLEFLRMSNVASRLRSVLTRPEFRHSNDPPEVMTEGHCRSVLPNWALTSFRKIQASEGESSGYEEDYL